MREAIQKTHSFPGDLSLFVIAARLDEEPAEVGEVGLCGVVGRVSQNKTKQDKTKKAQLGKYHFCVGSAWVVKYFKYSQLFGGHVLARCPRAMREKPARGTDLATEEPDG